MTILSDDERVGMPCQAVTSKGPCECTGFVKGEKSQQYTLCAVEGCGNTAQIHYEKSDTTVKIKR